MDKKNTLLLTVIAVATLLVAIVGATFAYFTAQIGGGKEAQITVETKTVDSTSFVSFGDLLITADQENFAKGKGSLRGETSGYVSLVTRSDTTSETPSKYCYTATIEVTSNDFVYSLPKTDGESHNANYPELVLSVYKKTTDTVTSDAAEEAKKIDEGDTYLYNQSYLLSNNRNVTYDTVLENTNICDGKGENCSSGSDKTIKGYNITILGNDEVTDSIDTDLHGTKTLEIPTQEKISASYDANNFIHEISAANGNKTKYDLWKVAVTFVNYSDNDIDTTDTNGAITNWKAAHQNSTNYADQHDNEGNTFDAKLKFASTTCPGTGA